MKFLKLSLCLMALLPMMVLAQYTGPSGSSGSGSGTDTLLHAIGPTAGIAYFEATSFAKCWQEVGSPSEPCPWTLPYQALYDNSWKYEWGPIFYALGNGQSVRYKIDYVWSNGTETWVRNSDDAEFTRKYANKVYDDHYYIED